MGFYAAAIILFASILVAIGRARCLAERAPLYLVFLLYMGLFCHRFVGAEEPSWLVWMNTSLFVVGAVLLLSTAGLRALKSWLAKGADLRDLERGKGPLFELVLACRCLSQARLGGLLIVERRKSLEAWARKGIPVNALLSHELLFAIFTPPGALHDAATIVAKDRVVAGGVITPLTQASHFPKELGTRHRAAVGFTEKSDGLCLVVSEESGAISIADEGSLYYDVLPEKLPELLASAMRFQLHKNKALCEALEAARTPHGRRFAAANRPSPVAAADSIRSY